VEYASQILAVRADDQADPLGTGFESVLNFSVVVYHDNTPYPAGRNLPYSTWK
jgi:hypothetical protein